MHSKVLIVALMLLLTNISAAETISLVPVKDNTLIQNSNPAGQLSNARGDIYVGRTNQDGQNAATISIRRGLVKFDIADALPPGALITGASLTMCDIQGLNGNQVVTLHDLTRDWGEGTSFFSGGQGAAATNGDATWLYTFYNAANPAASPTWNMPGGDFSSLASGAATVSTGLSGQLFTWTGPQMLIDVQAWLDSPASNFGWLIQGNESQGQTAKRLESRELPDAPAQSTPPTLVIQYVTPTPEPPAFMLELAAAAGLMVIGPRMRKSPCSFRLANKSHRAS